MWVIYKNEFRIGEARSWHKALDILIKQEELSDVRAYIFMKYISVTGGYKIIKES